MDDEDETREGRRAVLMQHIDNDGVRIGYRVRGQGEPLVLVHGWSCEGRYWDEFGYVDRLSREFRVVVPDLRAHGASGTPANHDFTDAAFASDVIAVLDELEIASAHIFGYSLGGWVAFEIMATHPSRVRSLISGGAHPYAEELSGLRAFTPSATLSSWDALDAPLSEESRKRLLAFDPGILSEIVRDRIDLSKRLEGLPNRSLMICGSADERFEGMQRFAAASQRREFVRVHGANHLHAWMLSDLVVPPLRCFLHAA